MRLPLLCISVLLPLAVLAQDYSHSPLIIVKPTQERPAAPPAPQTPARAAKPDRPASPEAPPSPLTKLYPRDTVPIFMTRCTRFHVEMAKPCFCIITNVMADIPHDEFVAINARNQMEMDPRILSIRQKCTADLQNQKTRPLQGEQ